MPVGPLVVRRRWIRDGRAVDLQSAGEDPECPTLYQGDVFDNSVPDVSNIAVESYDAVENADVATRL